MGLFDIALLVGAPFIIWGALILPAMLFIESIDE